MAQRIAKHPTVRARYAARARRRKAWSREGEAAEASRGARVDGAARGTRRPAPGRSAASRSGAVAAATAATARSAPAGGRHGRSAESGSRALNEELLRFPRDSPCTRSSSAARPAARDARGRRDRLGPRRRRSHSRRWSTRGSRAALRPGHGARHVLAPPHRAPRRARPGETVRAHPAPGRSGGAFEIHNSPALRAGGARLRVRLLGRGAAKRSCSGKRSSATSSTARR